jgi:hypothetical protein
MVIQAHLESNEEISTGFRLRTPLLAGTIVLRLTLSGLTAICRTGTVYYKACTTLDIGQFSSDASLMMTFHKIIGIAEQPAEADNEDERPKPVVSC